MACEQYIVNSIASTDYVNCVVTAVSGTLQSEINAIIPGSWEILASSSASSLDKNTTVTLNSIPARDILKVFVHNSNFEGSVIGIRWAMGLNGDFTAANYMAGGKGVDVMTLRSDRDQSNGIEYTVYNVSGLKKIVRAVGHSFDSLGNMSSTTGDVYDVWNTTSGQISSLVFQFNHSGAFTSANGDNFRVIVLGMNLS